MAGAPAADTFARAVVGWQGFYTLVGTASATLIGLLFVALSLHLSVFVRGRHRDVEVLAGQAFAGFVSVLICSLFFLVPAQDVGGIGWPLVVIGAVGAGRTSSRLRAVAGSTHEAVRGFGAAVVAIPFWSFVAPMACYLGMTAVGAAVLAIGPRESPALYWLIAVVCILLITSTRNAWDLLLQEKGTGGDETRAGAGPRE